MKSTLGLQSYTEYYPSADARVCLGADSPWQPRPLWIIYLGWCAMCMYVLGRIPLSSHAKYTTRHAHCEYYTRDGILERHFSRGSGHKLKSSQTRVCLVSALEPYPLWILYTATAMPFIYSFSGNSAASVQFPHSCVYERFIYSQDQSTYFLQKNRQTHRVNI